MGSFDRVFTTTSDIIATYTQAVLVTGNDGVNVGTAVGQVPPVGSVYNVIYRELMITISSTPLPTPSGSEVSMIQANQGVVTRSSATLIDASAPPVANSAAGGYRFVPVSDFEAQRVNGLPPRTFRFRATSSSTCTTPMASGSGPSTPPSPPSGRFRHPQPSSHGHPGRRGRRQRGPACRVGVQLRHLRRQRVQVRPLGRAVAVRGPNILQAGDATGRHSATSSTLALATNRSPVSFFSPSHRCDAGG